jgi:hypothetical protein
MTATIARTSGGRPNILGFAWMLPAFAIVLLTIGAIAGLVNGMPAPDVIGADGLASTFLAVP